MRLIAFALLPVLCAPAAAEQGAYDNIGPAVFALAGGVNSSGRGFLGQAGWAGAMPRGGFLYEAQATADGALGPRPISGMVETCGIDPERNILVCSILAAGTRYLVADDGTSDTDLLMQLVMQPEWTSVTAIVDVLDEVAATAKADLLDLEVRAPDEYTRLVEVLHGTWAEVSRPGSGLQFDDTQLAETLQGVPVRKGDFDILSECQDLPGPHLSVVFDDGDQLCWVILDQTSDRLRLRRAGDGTDVIYEKR
ncbi:hypothetical protein [uncultured Mameliella sp.]|uniref:hypothetical protein n=1 Tax=uncultured Mameliella sp. TaxID=1447087 RepID=UPI002638C6F9|nr:hypothetical protein [uncultured Mameliella sp.]